MRFSASDSLTTSTPSSKWRLFNANKISASAILSSSACIISNLITFTNPFRTRHYNEFIINIEISLP